MQKCWRMNCKFKFFLRCFLKIINYFIKKLYYFSGGVILMNQNRKIRCINDLVSRLDLVFDQSCPEIKKMLFSDKK